MDPTSGNFLNLRVKLILFHSITLSYLSTGRTSSLLQFAGDYVTLELLVPENLVGGLIGRFGANISRIRNESGANIKVAFALIIHIISDILFGLQFLFSNSGLVIN